VAADSTAAGAVAGGERPEMVCAPTLRIAWKAVFAGGETLVKKEKLCRAIQCKCFGSHR